MGRRCCTVTVSLSHDTHPSLVSLAVPCPAPRHSRSTLADPSRGFTLLILSDTLWLHDEHTNLLSTISSTLSCTEPGYVYFTTGFYATARVVNDFFRRIQVELGMEYEELFYGDKWEGEMVVDVGIGRKRSDLDVRKAAVWCYRAWRKGLKPES